MLKFAKTHMATTARSRGLRVLGAAFLALALVSCQEADELGYGPKHLRPITTATREAMRELGLSETAPVLMRIFKQENVFEVWKQDRTGRYVLLKSYDICKWSGRLGPKIKEGDRQAPEGYYTITPGLMNPNSSYHLAFNTGFPNAYDRANGRTGTALMVHGACSSRGCYAMTDAQIQEIYALARDAFRGGQKAFQLQAYPFRMTAENLGKHWNDPNMPFWKMLKEGYDHFELTRMEPKVDVCGRKYVFNVTPKGDLSPAAACPELVQPEALRVATAKKAAEDEKKAIVIAARLDEERKATEERQILIAQREEERKRREEAVRIAAADNSRALGSLFGLVDPATGDQPAAGTVVAAAAADTPAATGEPVPRPAPRDGSTMMAMVEAAPAAAESSSMFSRLFTFGGDAEEEAAVVASAEAAVEATPGAEAAGGAVLTPDPTTTAALPRPVAPAAVPASPAEPAASSGTVQPACAPAGSPAAAGTPVCPPVVSAAAPPSAAAAQDNPGLFDRLTGWF